jgi:outer membrane autotransporter protein
MKKVFFSCVAIATLMLFSSVGSVFAAENTGFYVSVIGGYVIPQTMTVSNPDNSSQYFDTTLKNGYLLGIKTGWLTPFTRRIMAMEIEYNYINNAFDKDKVVNVMGEGLGTLDGTITLHSVLFNLKARYPEGRIHPYAGFGLGYSYFVLGDTTARESGGPGVGTISHESGGAFCWQLMTGVDFEITPNFGIGIEYKYFATKPSIGNKDSDDLYADIDYKTSIITLGLNFTF